jgi:hypothetical protein
VFQDARVDVMNCEMQAAAKASTPVAERRSVVLSSVWSADEAGSASEVAMRCR